MGVHRESGFGGGWGRKGPQRGAVADWTFPERLLPTARDKRRREGRAGAHGGTRRARPGDAAVYLKSSGGRPRLLLQGGACLVTCASAALLAAVGSMEPHPQTWGVSELSY